MWPFRRRLHDNGTAPPRLIHINDAARNAAYKYLGNSISTAKYNALTFLPKFLFEQFSKYANLFFLFTACIQQIDGVSPTSRFSTVVPLSIVIMVSAWKELLEDFRRHRSDHEVNERPVKTLRNGAFVEKRWQALVVGDIVRVQNGDAFPADLILLSSSEPDALCYIETANLDGETNLKIRQGLPETMHIMTTEQAAAMRATIQTEQPNNSLYTFEGTIHLQGRDMPLDPTQILLRGAQLRNTQWVYGVVVFTGHDSKLLRNSSATPTKRTLMDRQTNTLIVYLFFLLVLLCVFSTIGGVLFKANESVNHTYLRMDATIDWWNDLLYNFLTFIILYNNLIPMSLIVTVEMVKYMTGLLIASDLDMYHVETNTPATVRTSSLVEELGQIEYIFSDKTGTLTCNKMALKRCLVAGRTYVDRLDEHQPVADPTQVNEAGYELGVYAFKDIAKNIERHETSKVLWAYMVMLAVCHTVIPEQSEETGEIMYQASSPDEGALVTGASELGFKFIVRRPKSITIDALGQALDFDILHVLEFNSTRKRMSVITRTPEGKIVLYCKGADTVILERLAEENPFVDPTLVQLEDCASEGLRTLCLARREIPEREYNEWKVIHDKAANTINNRSEALDKAAELIEKDLFLLGATAIEDKLQDGVPETIHILAEAGIKIWVLTGDRQETAINIGYSCRLLTEDMTLIVLNEETHFETKEFIESRLRAIKTGGDGGRSQLENESFALIIDGRTLGFALEKDMEKLFLELACLCKAVICCRVSPLQKALVVKLVKRNKESLLLAIGDGANDVSMIQAAHVGIGISGEEGLQAARSADFAISQFRFLRKLLLVHGAWSYRRLSKLILYSFYKNIFLYLFQFWFAFHNKFSGQTIFESWLLGFYNVAFTALPPLLLGIFDQHVGARQLDAYPELYKLGHQNRFFTVRIFWQWMAHAVLNSLILYLCGIAMYGDDLQLATGILSGHWFLGTLFYSVVLSVVTAKAALITDYWTKWGFLGNIGSWAFLFIFLPIYVMIGPTFGIAEELIGVIPRLYTSGYFWLSLFIFPVVALFRDYTWKYYKRQYRPETYHIVQELQKFNIPDYRPRMDRFKKAVHKVRMIQRLKRNRGFAFSQTEGQASLIRRYDTTKRKPRG